MKYRSLLEQTYPYKTELHAHTKPCSSCSEILPADVIRNYAAIGCHSVVITNHMTPTQFVGESAYLDAEGYLADYYAAVEEGNRLGISVILGVELRFTENNNDYLIYGISPEDIEPLIRLIPAGIQEFYRTFKNQKNLIIQAHPFRKGCELAPRDSIDGIEAFNLHPGHNSRVAVAAKHARETGLLLTGGTDYHHPNHQGMCLLRTPNLLRDSYDLADAIRAQDYLLDVWGNLILPDFES
ncbi:MAG: PHP domain-containing protein [Clostridia bacterium]|nr:PHP domain-containing protein [Clostridia bacterium]